MDSFTIYRSVFNALMACDAETCKEVLQMIGDYAMDERAPETPGNAFGMFLAIKPLIDARKKKAEAGCIGGKKRAEKMHLLENDSGTTQANSSTEVANASTEVAKEESRKKKEENIKENKEKDMSSNPSEYPYKEIIGYLNEKAGKKFEDKSKDTRKHISARFSEGRTLDDFYLVIDNMTAAWKGDPKMDAYLRPATLFGSSQKFENYMNQVPQRRKPQNRFNNFPQREYDFNEMEKRLL